MRRHLAGVAGTAAALGLVALAVALVSSVPRDRLLDGYVLAVGGLVLLALVRAAREAGDAAEASVYERALRRHARRAQRPHALERLEREVVLGATNAFDLHVRVRPVLREIAAHRLESRRGIDLDAGAPATRELLGEELWELVRPDRAPPDDRFAPGVPLDRLRRHVRTLEGI